MQIQKEDNTTIITPNENSIIELIKEINSNYSDFEKDNIIVNLDEIKTEEVSEFIKISDTHRQAKHSFVLVSSAIDIDDAPEELVLVPTIQEAHDIIEMEEMERDLGF